VVLAELADSPQAFDERRLDTAICRLRARWLAATGQPLPMKTRHAVGYFFAESLKWA
jgi:hypothetical protein